MKGDKRNIEDFIKDKLEGFDAGYQNDWAQFEAKLDRAILYYRLKVGALVGVVLILITLGIAGTEGIGQVAGSSDSASTEASFLNNLRHQAPFLQAIKLRSKYGSSKLGTPSSDVSIEASPSIAEASSEQQVSSASALVKEKQEEILLLDSKADGTPGLVAVNPVKELRLSGSQQPANKSLLSAKAADPVNEISTLDQEEVITSKPVESTLELPVAANTEYLNDLHEDQPELFVRQPLMPIKFGKRAPYVSPMQAQNPWSYSLSVYPNFTFRKFKVDKEKLNLLHRDFIDATQEAEKGGFSLNVGLVVSRRIGPITYLNGGVEYINYKANAEYNFSNFREANISPVTNRIEYYTLLDEPEQIVFSGKNVYHYLNFPLSISHQPWASDHIRLNIEAGGSFLYFLGARGQSIDYQSLEIIDISEREYNRTMASLHMKVGVCYYVSDKLNFGLEPTLMYFTNTIYSEDYPFQVIPYSVGVNLKLQVKLN